MKSYTDVLTRLQACRTADDMRQYATDLYASDLLDESEQTTVIGSHGPLAPWSVPDSAEIIDDAGEDIVVRLPGGDVAEWSNSARSWLDIEND